MTYERTRFISSFTLILGIVACGGEPSMAPVSATAPATDERILNASLTMSDGTPVPVHITDTVTTSIPLVSGGVIGGVAAGADGSIYSANFEEGVWRVAPDGKTILLNDEFSNASGNFALANGDLLQADYVTNQIFRIRPDGERELFAEENLDGPVGITQLHDGSFLVANHRGKFLARVPGAGGRAEVLLRDERMQEPNGVTIDSDGNAYISDLDTGTVLRWRPGGTLEELAHLPGRGNAHAAIANGALYVNKIWDHVIYRVDLETGAYGIVTGNGRAGYTDGPTGVATIEEPNGIASTKDGTAVYFNTHRGQMFEAPGEIILRRLQLDGTASD